MILPLVLDIVTRALDGEEETETENTIDSHDEIVAGYKTLIMEQDEEINRLKFQLTQCELHLCYTCVTLVLHLCYTCVILVVTLVLHFCYTCVILVVTLVLHFCYTCVTLVLHLCYTCITIVVTLVALVTTYPCVKLVVTLVTLTQC